MNKTHLKAGLMACALCVGTAYAAQPQIQVPKQVGKMTAEFGTRTITPYYQLMGQIMTAAHQVKTAQQAAAFTSNLKVTLPRLDAAYRPVSASLAHAEQLVANKKLNRDHVTANKMLKEVLAHEEQFSADSDRIIKLYPQAAAVFDQMQAIHNN